ncbi:MotA/TolQ/ExbB proton channel family protein [Flavobacterium sp.]|jgi:biopolymer transport protein ExbB|uniref:MotA/TolQ/ExbB proton channel family protein n=1 Tax=Flavobacterium sp. TaxID=239 RepID=UPI002B4AEC3C|nr:MotA/TolQ/ExbB proton channel family protein [Flavobacterium sp.]HLF50969.1 MotA/TolQ/ExbB proton channel family protein [Flavobacterium sp.]
MMFLNFLLQVNPVTDTIANAATTADMDVSVTENISYLDFLLKGGVMIIPIILLLFFCVYVIIERYLSIKKATKQDVNLVNDVKMQLKTGKLDNAIMLCSRENTASGNILRSGISIIGRPISEIESNMDRTANVEIAQMEKGLGHLGLISGIAPILGFVGTIMGVIKIFHTISNTGNLNIQTISGGLYEKMISSGAGLVVGVIAYSAYHLFNMMIDNYSLKMQKQTLEIINVIQEP